MPDHAPSFPDIVLPHLDGIKLPRMRRVRVRQPDMPSLKDPAAAVHAALDGAALLFALGPGASVAVAVGSRGIADIDVVAGAAVGWLRSRGFAPFIVPGGRFVESQLERH